MALRPDVGHGLLILEVSRSHTTTRHSRYDSSGRVIGASQRPLPDITQHSQQTTCLLWDSNPQSRRRSARDLRLRPRGHWDRHFWGYLLTSWCSVLPEKLTGFAASQEIPGISPNPKVHYRTHKRPPTVSILGQPNPVHIPTSHLLEIQPNVIHTSTPRSPQWSPSLRFPHQDPIHPPLNTHTRHMGLG